MKKSIIGVLLISVLLLCSCGDVSEVEIKTVKSNIYTNEDIQSAINVVIKNFKKEFDGCKLLEIYYVGDDRKEEFDEWAKNYKKDEVIILESSFYVDSSGESQGFNPDYTYKDFGWILARNKGEAWELRTCGY